MNETEYAAYCAESVQGPTATVHVDEVPGPDRTLVYGYARPPLLDNDERTRAVHVYKKNGLLHVVFYVNTEQVYAESGTALAAETCSPKKRAYPERCDAGFARLMRAKGEPLCFTTFDAARSAMSGPFHGLLIEETQAPEGSLA